MKLVVRRNQSDIKGMLGGHKGVNFTLTYQLRLTSAEQELVQRYRLGEHTLCRNRQGLTLLTVSQAISGNTENMTSVETLLNNENAVKAACREFKVLLDVASSFGGEEVIEID